MNLKRILSAGMILLIICIAGGICLFNKPHKSVADLDASIQMSADSLYNDYQHNESNANKKYLNNVIEVRGTISEIEIVNGSQIILFNSSHPTGGISCKLFNNENNIPITNKKNVTITVKGKCSGFLMDVNLVDCVVKN
jgi:hypothetical protein